MFALRASLYSWHRTARLATLVMIFSVAWMTAAHAQTQNATSTQTEPSQSPPYAEFQNSTLTGSGNTISASSLPVVTAGGILYFDVVVQFDVDADGNLTVSAGYPQYTKSPQPLVDHFKAGTYLGPDDSTELITVSGPGVGGGGTTVWSLGPASGASGCLYPYTATWYVVKKLSDSPLAKRLKAAGITNTNLSYGVGKANCGGGAWETDSLLGFDQTAGSIAITSFSFDGQDFNVPQDTRTYQHQ
jgi:hypothetical protein